MATRKIDLTEIAEDRSDPRDECVSLKDIADHHQNLYEKETRGDLG